MRKPKNQPQRTPLHRFIKPTRPQSSIYLLPEQQRLLNLDKPSNARKIPTGPFSHPKKTLQSSKKCKKKIHAATSDHLAIQISLNLRKGKHKNFAKEIINVNIQDELKQSYLSYALSVIHGRALPDIRDGLKPVHRRILFAMHDLKNTYNKPYKKSARVVGDVIGKYHPHGDSAVYEAMVRMAQDFSMRYMVVEGQGNFGSIDGDRPAAMRYTEVRMAKITDHMLGDLEKDTVSFSPNYDGSEFIPDVLPTKIPYLLINGSSGIAVGMATNIPPHNLTEVINGCLKLVEKPDSSIDDLIHEISGPDFPTGGTIDGRAGIYEAYKTGRGIIHIRSNTSIEEDKNGKQSLIVNEIPYMVNKAKMLEKIAELVKEKKIEGITEIRDESDKDGLRVVIEVRKGDSVEVLENNLFAQTQLEQSFGINLTVLVDGQPREVNLKEILEAFIKHRKNIITKRILPPTL